MPGLADAVVLGLIPSNSDTHQSQVEARGPLHGSTLRFNFDPRFRCPTWDSRPRTEVEFGRLPVRGGAQKPGEIKGVTPGRRGGSDANPLNVLLGRLTIAFFDSLPLQPHRTRLKRLACRQTCTLACECMRTMARLGGCIKLASREDIGEQRLASRAEPPEPPEPAAAKMQSWQLPTLQSRITNTRPASPDASR